MVKVPHQVYTAEFKEAAVQRVKDGQGVSAVARELGMSTQTLRNWLKASEAGKLNGPGAKVVTAEQMELSRLRAENKRLQGAGNRKKCMVRPGFARESLCDEAVCVNVSGLSRVSRF